VGEPTEAALKVMVEKFGTDDPSFNHSLLSIATPQDLTALSHKQKLLCVSQVNDFIESKYRKIATLEFSRDRKSMSVLVEKVNGGNTSPSRPVTRRSGNSQTASSPDSSKRLAFVKGAPEAVLERCKFVRGKDGGQVPLTDKVRDIISHKVKKDEIWYKLEIILCIFFSP